MNVVRLKLPQPTRFKAFTVSDYRDILLLRNEMSVSSDEEQQIFDELLEELYPEYTPLLREFIFINVLLSSLGKESVEAQFKCPDCNTIKNLIIHMKQKPLVVPRVQIENLTLRFRYPTRMDKTDILFLDCIDEVDDGVTTVKWVDMSEKDKDAVISVVTYDVFAEIISKLTMLDVFQTVTCCKTYNIKYNTGLEMFKAIVNPQEIFNLYKVNHVLTKHGYSVQDIMQMYPYERSIALTQVQKDMK